MTETDGPIGSLAAHARPSTPQELAAMERVIARFDEAMRGEDFGALPGLFDSHAIAEVKPVGMKLTGTQLIGDLFRRTLPALRPSFSGRRKLRQWSNQNGVLREWAYPVREDGRDRPTRQLEVIEFADGLDHILSYRLRMNMAYARRFAAALGADFFDLPGVERVAG